MGSSFTLNTTAALITPHRGAVALFLALLFCSFLFPGSMPAATAEQEEARFEIQGFMVEGNTLLPDRPIDDDPKSPLKDFPTIQTTLEHFIGPDKTVEDIEQARAALEHIYHKNGYISVLVNIPEQTLEDGMVRLEVVESVIRRVRVTGNRSYTMENILADLPSLREGKVLNLPHLQEELLLVNRNQDLRVEPLLLPGKHFGTVDVELKVKDNLPIHGSLELNNRASTGTTDLRLNGVLRYDNLWQMEHSASLQYQTSPQDTDEVQVIAGSYVLPTPWHDDHRLAFYSIWSDSNTAFGEGFQMVGSGFILGMRYVMPLAPYELYSHNVSAGLDYKDFDETATFFNEDLKTPITYLPFNLSYNGSLTDEGGVTNFSAALNMAFRGLVSDQREFEMKRFRANANYLFLTAGVEREQKLPWETRLFAKLDGQLSEQPLISNEQYTAGGMESVRGYKESSGAGDNAIHSTIELRGPTMTDFAPFSNLSWKSGVYPFAFYDIAYLAINDALTGQDSCMNLQGTGFGLRGSITDYLDYETILAWALRDQDKTEPGDMMINFKVKSHF